jgi:hypothetical protein
MLCFNKNLLQSEIMFDFTKLLKNMSEFYYERLSIV